MFWSHVIVSECSWPCIWFKQKVASTKTTICFNHRRPYQLNKSLFCSYAHNVVKSKKEKTKITTNMFGTRASLLMISNVGYRHTGTYACKDHMSLTTSLNLFGSRLASQVVLAALNIRLLNCLISIAKHLSASTILVHTFETFSYKILDLRKTIAK